MKTLTNVFKAS